MLEVVPIHKVNVLLTTNTFLGSRQNFTLSQVLKRTEGSQPIH